MTDTIEGYQRPNKRLFSTVEAAEYLSISEKTFRKYRKLGYFPFIMLGANYRYDPADLDAFAQKRRSA